MLIIWRENYKHRQIYKVPTMAYRPPRSKTYFIVLTGNCLLNAKPTNL